MNRKFRTTTDIYHDIADKIMVGCKLPHDISLPVLCKIDGSFYIGVFVFFYTKEERDTMMIGRPTLWAIFDIKTGRLMEKYETCKRDFSDASYDKKYNITPDPEYMPDPEWTFEDMHEYFLNAFNDFDEIRKEIIEFKDYDPVVYRRYIDEILARIPDDYQRFYRDLSVKV